MTTNGPTGSARRLNPLPVVAVCLALVAVTLAGTAVSLDDPPPRTPTAAALPETPTAIVLIRRERIVVTATPSPLSTWARTATARPTETPAPWATRTPTPLPTSVIGAQSQFAGDRLGGDDA